jgi:hypothetical protein
MKIEHIIDQLLSHEISKSEALEKIKEITDGLRKNNAYECKIEEMGRKIPSDRPYMKILFPTACMNIDHVHTGDTVDVILLP